MLFVDCVQSFFVHPFAASIGQKPRAWIGSLGKDLDIAFARALKGSTIPIYDRYKRSGLPPTGHHLSSLDPPEAEFFGRTEVPVPCPETILWTHVEPVPDLTVQNRKKFQAYVS